MTHSPTTKENWNIEATARQSEINELLDAFQLEIEMANDELARLYEKDPEAAGEYAQSIISYLDEKWPYHGDFFMVSGHWYAPRVGISYQGILYHHEKMEIFGTALSNGFIVNPIENEDDDSEVPRVGFSFSVGSHTIATAAIQGTFQMLAFAEPGEVSIQYVRPNNPEVVSGEISEIHDALMRADALLKLYTTHEASAFYSQPPKKQEAFFRSIFDIVDSALPSLSAFDIALTNNAHTPLLYMTIDGKICKLRPSPDQRAVISGTILGVSIPDILRDGFGTRYTSPDELEASKTGLCLIVEPTYGNFDIPENTGPYMLIPHRSIDQFEIALQ